jgi:hypothetical protein
MNTYLRVLFAAAFCMACYLIGSFYSVTFEIELWSPYTRFIVALAFFAISCGLFVSIDNELSGDHEEESEEDND